ncbi:preprotein translocase subunit YajC, partial [Halobacteriales archaeon SW_7_71_33]
MSEEEPGSEGPDPVAAGDRSGGGAGADAGTSTGAGAGT